MRGQQSRVRLTAGRVANFVCPPDKSQSFLWDTQTPTLALRATPTGRKTYVFEGRLNGATIRIGIGTLAWPIDKARAKAEELKMLVDRGTDPRQMERENLAAASAKRDAAQRAALTVGDVWAVYLADRRPRWSDVHYRDHVSKAALGGETVSRGTRGTGVTQPGPLAALMPVPLSELDAATVEAWAEHEARTRKTSARLAWRLLKVFLGWCAQKPDFAPLLIDKNLAKTTKAREALGKAATKSDVLQREQLSAWFTHVKQLANPVIVAYLQVLLLTGARPGEAIALRWSDVDAQWKGLTIRDKTAGERIIPATPYVLHLLATLPRANAWVFSSARFVRPVASKQGHWENVSASGRLSDPNNAHTRACTAAGLHGLTLHGLRRSFASLTEWLEVPTGVVAQIMGHKPSATAEKHYKIRPLELLRSHHERIEAWILEQAGVKFDATVLPAGLRLAT